VVALHIPTPEAATGTETTAEANTARSRMLRGIDVSLLFKDTSTATFRFCLPQVIFKIKLYLRLIAFGKDYMIIMSGVGGR